MRIQLRSLAQSFPSISAELHIGEVQNSMSHDMLSIICRGVKTSSVSSLAIDFVLNIAISNIALCPEGACMYINTSHGERLQI
jgi:hypothetical protein